MAGVVPKKHETMFLVSLSSKSWSSISLMMGPVGSRSAWVNVTIDSVLCRNVATTNKHFLGLVINIRRIFMAQSSAA